MPVQYFIVSVFALLLACGSVFGQTSQRPSAARFKRQPPAPKLPPTQVRPIPTNPSPTHTARAQQVRIQPYDTLPKQAELVSILKRKLPPQNETFEVKDAPEWFQTMMQRIVRENVPQKYVQDKDWGKTERRWAGVKVQRKGVLDWHTKRQWKEVNDGTWKRYEVTQIDPNENLKMRIENVRDAGAGRVGFEVALAAKLHVFGRMANWAKGIQMYNISVDADASVVMRVWCRVGMRLDVRKFPPDVVLLPEVIQADMDIADFQLQRVSKLKGPMVKQLSGSVQKILIDKIREKRKDLPGKINRQIAKNQDQMRLSLSDFASSKWDSLTSGKEEAKAEIKKETKEEVLVEEVKLGQTEVKETVPESKATLPVVTAPIVNPLVPNQSALRSILVRSKRPLTATMPVATQSVAPEFVPLSEPVATRATEDVAPAVELLELLSPSELATSP